MHGEKTWLHAVVLDVLPKGLYRVRCFDGRELTVAVSRECRRIGTRFLRGDTVEVKISSYDASRGRLRGLRKEKLE